jgi:hypothetical protein
LHVSNDLADQLELALRGELVCGARQLIDRLLFTLLGISTLLAVSGTQEQHEHSQT